MSKEEADVVDSCELWPIPQLLDELKTMANMKNIDESVTLGWT
jgi:hypothetical protein